MRDNDAVAAGAALSTWMSLGGAKLTKFSHLRGVFQMIALDANISNATPKSVNKSLSELSQSFLDVLSEAKTDKNQHNKSQEETTAIVRNTTASMLRGVRKKSFEFRKAKEAEIK